MSHILRIAGLDPSLSNWGCVKGNLNVETSNIEITAPLLIQTLPSKNKRVRVNSDDLSRAKAIYTKLHLFLKNVDLVFAELPVGSQNSRSQTSYGVCVSILASINLPLIQVMPLEVKMAATGSKTATKNAMIGWAYEKHPNIDWFTKKTPKGIGLLAKNEHIADAIASIYAGIQTDQYNQAKTFLTSKGIK